MGPWLGTCHKGHRLAINTCGDFVQETKLRIVMIHKNAVESTGFLVDGTGTIQFCVLLSCPHIGSSCADDFNTASSPQDVCSGKLGDFILTARRLAVPVEQN